MEMKGSLSTMTPIKEEDSIIISDSLSNFSTNSRNFQMPEKDLIKEISRMKEQQYDSQQMLTVSLDNTNLIDL